MDEKSLKEVVDALDMTPRDRETRLEPVSTESSDSAQHTLLDGLRATEWMLSDLRERCRQLHGYRMQLLARLEQMGDFEEELLEADDEMPENVVPGPSSLQ